MATVHIDLATNTLADSQIGELRLLEICINPDFAERSDGPQTLAGLHVIAGIDAATRHNAVNLAHNVAVTEIQLGLCQITARLLQLRLRLSDRRRLRNKLRINAIEVPLRIEFEELFDRLFG